MGLIQDIKNGIKDSGQLLDELADRGTKGLIEIGRKLGFIPPVRIPVPVREPKSNSDRVELRYQINDLSRASMPSWDSDWSK